MVSVEVYIAHASGQIKAGKVTLKSTEDVPLTTVRIPATELVVLNAPKHISCHMLEGSNYSFMNDAKFKLEVTSTKDTHLDGKHKVFKIDGLAPAPYPAATVSCSPSRMLSSPPLPRTGKPRARIYVQGHIVDGKGSQELVHGALELVEQ